MKELSFVQVRMWLNVTHVQHSQIEREREMRQEAQQREKMK